jgi:copper homeostasis protein
MIRHKEGDFAYDDEDVEIMKKDILASKEAGAKGVVFGILDNQNNISGKNKELAKLGKDLGLEVTFHRAFDFVPDPEKAIKKIIEYGFDRLLTSGKEESAFKGLSLIEKLQQEYGDQIQIMAGSGVNAGNALRIAASGIKNLHFTARKSKNQPVTLSMGELMIVDEDKIKSIIGMF